MVLNIVAKIATIIAHLSVAILLNPISVGMINHINSIVALSSYLNFAGLMDLGFGGKASVGVGKLHKFALIGNSLGCVLLMLIALLCISKGENDILTPVILGFMQLPLYAFNIIGQYKIKRESRFVYLAFTACIQSFVFSVSYLLSVVCGLGIYSIIIGGYLQIIAGVLLFNYGGQKGASFTSEIESSDQGISRPKRFRLYLLHMIYVGSNVVMFQVPILMAGWFLKPEDLGIYSFSLLIASQSFMMISYFSRNILLPKFSSETNASSISLESDAKMKARFHYFNIASAIASSILLYFLIPVIFGNKWADAALISSILSIGFLFMGNKVVCDARMMAAGLFERNAIFSLGVNAFLIVVIGATAVVCDGLVQLSIATSVAFLIVSIFYGQKSLKLFEV